MKNPSLLLPVALVVAATHPAAAATHACAAITDRDERLACYDAAFPPPDQATKQPAGNPAEDFGRKTEAVKPTVDSVSAKVTAVDQQRDGRFVATLDNGQVWSQSELQSQARVAVGDTVLIRRGLLGSFLLVTRDDIATRVKRSR